MSQPPGATVERRSSLRVRRSRVRTPTVIQMEALECGAAALGIVLGYHRRVVPLERLRRECGVSRDGSKASNVLKAARNYGLVARGLRKEPGELPGLPLPMIVFWNFNHFLVVEGFAKDRVHLNDPAMGPRWVTDAEFDRSFTGVVLTFEPGPDFVTGGHFRRLRDSLWTRLSGSKVALGFAILAGLLLVVPGLLVPTFTRIFVDRFLVGGLFTGLTPLLAAMLGTLAVMAVLRTLQQSSLLRLGQKLALTTASSFMWHVLHLPVEFFSVRYAGDIASRAQLSDRLAQVLSTQLATNAVNLLMIAFYALVMIQYDIPLTLIGVIVALLNLVLLRYIARRRKDLSRRVEQDEGKVISTAYSGLQMIETLKATGTESAFFARWAGFYAKSLNAEQELGASAEYLLAFPPLLASTATVAILTLGGERVISGTLSLGALVGFQYLMAAFTDPVTQVVGLAGDLQTLEGGLARLDDVHNYPTQPSLAPEPHDRHDGAVQAKLAGGLELRDVSFGYSRLEPPLIEGFSLKVGPGSRVALVGGSGSGKSTVAKLVSGLYQPWSGEILFDGRSREEYPRATLTSSVALVDQDIFLFEGTVRENLTLWDGSIPEPRVVRAAQDAGIHKDVAARSGGYASAVEEAGSNFSGGQRQRLEIARALVENPTILVLDEATSALDPATEKLIDDNVRRRGCTCLIVAHRLSTIRDCDEVIVLERGRIVERGTHDQLLSLGGTYSRLVTTE